MSNITSQATLGAAPTAELFLLDSFRTNKSADLCVDAEIEHACARSSFPYYVQHLRAQDAQQVKHDALSQLRRDKWRDIPSALLNLLDASFTLASAKRHKARLRPHINREAVLARLSPQTRCVLKEEDFLSATAKPNLRPWQRFTAMASAVAIMNAPLAVYGLMSLEAVHLRVCEKDMTGCHDVIMTKTQFEQATRQRTLPDVWQFVANCQFGWQQPATASSKNQPAGQTRRDTPSPTSPSSACCLNMAKTLRPRDEGGIAAGACCS